MQKRQVKYDSRPATLVTYPNGFRALILSEGATNSANLANKQQSMAALHVAVGQQDEPAAYRGIAHLLEHSLLLSSKKFPAINQFYQLILQHSGYHNALTGATATNYHFSIENSCFLETLNVFLSCFEAPLFPIEYVMNEIAVIDLEHHNNVSNDTRRLYEARRKCSNQASLYARLDLGCASCLNKPSIFQEMVKFYQEHYTPCKMMLVIVSSLAIDAILPVLSPIQMLKTSPKFTQKAPNQATKPISCPLRTAPLFEEQQLSSMLMLKSLNSSASILQLTWYAGPSAPVHVSSILRELFEVLFSSEDQHGILHVLRSLRLVNDVRIQILSEFSVHTLLEMQLDLTLLGADSIYQVIHIVSGYIEYLKGQIPRLISLLTDLVIMKTRTAPNQEIHVLKLIEYAYEAQFRCLMEGLDPFAYEIPVIARDVMILLKALQFRSMHVTVMAPFLDVNWTVVNHHDNLQYKLVPIPPNWKENINLQQSKKIIEFCQFAVPTLGDLLMQHENDLLMASTRLPNTSSAPEVNVEEFQNMTYWELKSMNYSQVCYYMKLCLGNGSIADQDCICAVRHVAKFLEKQLKVYGTRLITASNVNEGINHALWVVGEEDSCIIRLHSLHPSSVKILSLLIQYAKEVLAGLQTNKITDDGLLVTSPQEGQKIFSSPFEELLDQLDTVLSVAEKCDCPIKELDLSSVKTEYIQVIASGNPDIISENWEILKPDLLELNSGSDQKVRKMSIDDALYRSMSTVENSATLKTIERNNYPSLANRLASDFAKYTPFHMEIRTRTNECPVHTRGRLKPITRTASSYKHVVMATFAPQANQKSTSFRNIVSLYMLRSMIHPQILEALRFPVPLSYVVETVIRPCPMGIAIIHYAQCLEEHTSKVAEIVCEVQKRFLNDETVQKIISRDFTQLRDLVYEELRGGMQVQEELLGFLWQELQYTGMLEGEIKDIFANEAKSFTEEDFSDFLSDLFMNNYKTIVLIQ